ncbi:hypothetical protein IWQ62_003143 [Dispira parvispora]|uniref:Peptidase S1 domain-containing protein n=1 Tax=Dispira parvispora TaxID=1520584 RepID=A0A9W8E1Y6_9FUNG|nr:hypothetical protein IWQ62_003143 [Dispira parvispora]
MFDTKDKTLFCGGTLIDRQWFLTAAHCVTENLPETADVGFSDLIDINSFGLSFGDIDRIPDAPIGAKEIIVHEEYNTSGETNNDIALVRLAKSVTLGNNIKTIKIYSGQLKEKDIVQAAGIGVVNVNLDLFSSTLQTINLPIASTDVCQDVFDDYKDPNGPQVCAGGVKGQDTCQGDSGGPLYKVMANNQTVLVGLTSYGNSPNPNGPRCGDARGVGFYTHAYYYIDWISEKTGIPKDSLLDKPKGKKSLPHLYRREVRMRK